MFVIEAKRSNLGQAKKQCMLALKDMRDKNSKNSLFILNNFRGHSLWVNKEGGSGDR